MKHTHTAIVQLSADTLLYRYGRRHEGESSTQLARDKKHEVDIGEVSDLAAQATRALACSDLANLQRLGELLYNKVIPDKVAKYLSSQPASSDLVFDLDPEIAQVPWELLYDGTEFLCRRFRVSRLLVKSPEELEVAMRRDVLTGPGRVLVLRGDVSGLASEHELESIRRILLPAVGDNLVIRSAENKDDAIGLLTEGYDICHFIGHGEFSKQHPEDSGWKFPKGKVLTCSEIEQITSPGAIFPRLIIANSCDSARSGDTGPEAYVSALYHSFLSRGVQHYIGTIGRVPDDVSQVFSQSFYEAFASGRSIGEALFAAREVASAGIGWAFYVHYGDPGFSLPVYSSHPRSRLVSTMLTSETHALEAIIARRRQPTEVRVRRSAEIYLAAHYIRRFAQGLSGAVLIAGEAGVGKSDFLTDILDVLRRHAPHAICGITTCTNASSKRDYVPIKELVQSLISPELNVKSINDQTLHILHQCPQLSYLSRPDLLTARLGMTRPPLQIGSLDHELLLRELRLLLTELSQTHPVVIVLEDLQWADELSLDIFLSLCMPGCDTNMLPLGTYRSHGLSDSLSSRLTDARRRGVQVISLDFDVTLRPLLRFTGYRNAAAFVIRYLKQVLPMPSKYDRPSHDLVHELVDCTAGNGLLLSEVVRLLRARDQILRIHGKFYQIWVLRRDSRDRRNLLTARLRAWAEERVGGLDVDAKAILMNASVVGFDLKIMGKLLHKDPGELLTCLTKLETVHKLVGRLESEAEVVERVRRAFKRTHDSSGQWLESGSYYMRHGVLERYFRDLLESGQRRQLNRTFAEYLEKAYKREARSEPDEYYKGVKVPKELSYGGETLESLSEHFMEAGNYEKARSYSLYAATNYRDNAKVSSAIRSYRHALEMWKRLRPGDDFHHLESVIETLLPFEWEEVQYDHYALSRAEKDARVKEKHKVR